jgi:hypothetical protein
LDTVQRTFAMDSSSMKTVVFTSFDSEKKKAFLGCAWPCRLRPTTRPDMTGARRSKT